MKNIYKILVLLFIIFLVACGSPPKETGESHIFNWMTGIIKKLNSIVGDDNAQSKLMDEVSSTGDILKFNTGSIIKINSKEEKKSDLFYSLDGNRFITKKAIYTTFIQSDMYLSLDGEDWIIFKLNDLSPQNREYFFGDYHIYSDFDKKNNILNLIYTISFNIKENVKINFVKLKEKREIVSLKDNMILNDNDKKIVSIDLEKKILFIPENTTFSGVLNIEGNLLGSDCDGSTICVKSMRDIYIYAKNKIISLSFDGAKWGFSILSFQLKPNIHVKTTSENNILFELNVILSYKD